MDGEKIFHIKAMIEQVNYFQVPQVNCGVKCSINLDCTLTVFSCVEADVILAVDSTTYVNIYLTAISNVKGDVNCGVVSVSLLQAYVTIFGDVVSNMNGIAVW